MTLRWDSRRKSRCPVVSRPLSRPRRRHHRRARSTKNFASAKKTKNTPIPPIILPVSPGRRRSRASARDPRVGRLGDGPDDAFVLVFDQRDRNRRAALFRKPDKTIADFVWWKSWDAGRSRGSSWRKSASWPTGRWLSRYPGAARASRRRWRGCSTPISCRCTRTGSTRRPGFICSACPISAGSRLSRVLADPKVQTAVSGAVLAEALDRLDTAGELAGRQLGRPARAGPPVVLAGDRLVVRPAGRGPCPRPRPRRAAPRYQAVERAGHLRRHADAA